MYHADTVFEEQGPATGGAVLRFQGGGNAVGATVGALYKFNDQHTIGATYRSPFTIDFADHAVLQPGMPATPANATINFPQSVAVGYAFRPVARLKLEVDIEWTNWDPLNTVQLHAGPLHPALPYNWKDSFFYEFGAQYELNDRWTARAGYIFSENSVPDSTFSPTLPDANRHVLSAGLGCHVFKQLQVDAVYQYSFTESRTVAVGGPYDGKWTSDGHAIMITSTLHF